MKYSREVLYKLKLICSKCDQEKEVLINRSKLVKMRTINSDGKKCLKLLYPAYRSNDYCAYHAEKNVPNNTLHLNI